MITEQIANKAKAKVDTYTGAVSFEYGNLRFSVLTRKGVKHARKLAAENKVIWHKKST